MSPHEQQLRRRKLDEWREERLRVLAAVAGELENQGNPKISKNHCFTKVFEGLRRNLQILELEPHETREPGTRETRALPGAQEIANVQNRKIGEVDKVGKPIIFEQFPHTYSGVFDNFLLRTWRRCQKWSGNHTKKRFGTQIGQKCPRIGIPGLTFPSCPLPGNAKKCTLFAGRGHMAASSD